MARILVADDDTTLRALLAAILDRAGHDVVTASGGNEAIKALQTQGGFDLFIVDHLMPGVTGLGLVGWARKNMPAMKIVVMSSLDLARKAREAGADGYLQKPFADIDDVARRVGDILAL